MALDLVLLSVGIALLLGGGEAVVRGASALARSLGVSPLVIGITVVALGTSVPELAVNVAAALHGNGELAFGNVVGSNLANIGLVIGLVALFRPLEIAGAIFRREIPMMLLATVAALVMGLDTLLTGRAGVYDRGDALLLLLFLTVFLYYTLREIRRQRAANGLRQFASAPEGRSLMLNLLLTGLGLGALLFGAEFTVDAAVSLARSAGVDEGLIGLTLVSVGTSLPELAACFMASYRGHNDIAMGNIVGSNIFNLLLVLGVSGLAGPIPVPPMGTLDLWVLMCLSTLLLVVSMTLRKVVRWEAMVLLGVYLGYIGSRTYFAMGG